jgi:hypothetical protein
MRRRHRFGLEGVASREPLQFNSWFNPATHMYVLYTWYDYFYIYIFIIIYICTKCWVFQRVFLYSKTGKYDTRMNCTDPHHNLTSSRRVVRDNDGIIFC